MIEIQIEAGGKKIFKAKNSVLRKLGGISQFHFFGIENVEKILIEEDANYQIAIYFNSKRYTDFELQLYKFDQSDNEVIFQSDWVVPKVLYNQLVIDTFNFWRIDNDVNFQQLSQVSKKAWLTACLVNSGLPEYIEANREYICDCTFVRDEYDLFYLLGELFVGPKGYFGQDFDGLRDCLHRCYRKDQNVKIIWRNSENLKRVLEKKEDGIITYLMDLFNENGFSVIGG